MNMEEVKNEISNHAATLNNVFGENLDMESIGQTLSIGGNEEIIHLEQKLKNRLNELTNKSMGIDEPERSIM